MKVKTDPRQEKKHVSEMTPQEIQDVMLLCNRKFYLSEHAMEKMASESISIDQIEMTANYGSLFEVSTHTGKYKLRANLRLNIDTGGKSFACCVVFQLGAEDNEVITVWRNEVGDTHDTLIEDFYKWDGDVSRKVLEVLDDAP